MSDVSGRAINAFRWSLAFRLFGQVIVWAMTFYTIKLLEPRDYGIIALCAAFVGFLVLINDGGLSSSIIRSASMTRQEIKKIYGFSIYLSLFLFIVCYIFSIPFSLLFEAEELRYLVPFLGLQLLILSLGSVHQASLVREMRIKEKARNEFYATILGSTVTLLLAYLGFGVWSLAIGNLTIVIVRTGLNIIHSQLWILPSFSIRGIRDHMKYGVVITGQRMGWYLYRQSDVFIVGRVLGESVLGIYAVGHNLASLPLNKIGATLSEVMLTSFSRLEGEDEQRTYYFLRSLRALMTIFIPVFFGISLIAYDAVSVFLGEKWIDAAIVIQLVSFISIMRIINTVLGEICNARGRPDITFSTIVYGLILVPPALYIGTTWGLVGVCVAWLVCQPLMTTYSVVRSLHFTGAGYRQFGAAIIGPIAASALMYVVVVAASQQWAGDISAAVRLPLTIVAGVLSYVLISLVCNREGMKVALNLMIRK